MIIINILVISICNKDLSEARSGCLNDSLSGSGGACKLEEDKQTQCRLFNRYFVKLMSIFSTIDPLIDIKDGPSPGREKEKIPTGAL